MTKEQFENHSFSINTQIKFRGEWINITEVNFETGEVGIETGYYLKYDQFKDIK